ncbi:hypothetical protein FSS13T_11580 [Flavobacterium saliperosum S13]|uniref:Uncharacterized protein n=2 Tax=Flavobacterium saliperosum TaxID=329186 RepID=A0A1G4W586_9FLAO|nr:hypothetical protein [Flavobacterium saliperosum]ESU26168.1 hypothetical protein FSS13T_11580 [Flavobacterium saliperosum S13]SCX16163.1 hypothetical protein SAMN02927925_02345 [Flavobacterium saliperosum]
MKTFYKFAICILSITLSVNVYSQVGIGTTTPRAALEINSSTTGFLLPRVALTATNVAAPVINPQGGALVAGTSVWNTATTAGTYSVVPGVYFWDGTSWISQFQRKYNVSFVQNANLACATTASTYTNIPNLNAKSFVAPYNGTYQIILHGYLGATTVDDTDAKLGFVEGNFRLTVNGVNTDSYTYSTSFFKDGGMWGGNTDIYELFNQTTIIYTVQLTVGQTCNLNASYWGIADDNLTSASPHVIGKTTAMGNLCRIEVTYLGQ